MVYFSDLRTFETDNCKQPLLQNFSVYWRLKALWKLNQNRSPSRKLIQELLASLSLSKLKTPCKQPRTFQNSWMEFFTCSCGWLFYSPSTLPCGHTVCKLCFQKTELCPICGADSGEDFIVNTTLAGLVERWFPEHYESVKLKIQSKELINESKYLEAIDLLNEALEISQLDHIALNLRSEAYLAKGELKLAYKDAKRSCEINENCGESYLRLGEAYAGLNKLDDAVEAFNRCLELEPEDGELNAKVCNSLDTLLSMSPGPEIDISDDEDAESTSKEVPEGKPMESCSLDPVLHNLAGRQTKQLCVSESIGDQKQGSLYNDEPRKSENEYFERIVSHNNFACTSNTKEETTLVKEVPEVETCDKLSCSSENRTESCVSSASSFQSSNPSSTDLTSAPPMATKRSHSVSPTIVKKKAKINGQDPQLDDFECKLCFGILFQPITTACGHVFCKICLEKCIDYNPSCPICRRTITCSESAGVGNITEIIQKAIEHYFPDEISERKKNHEEHMKIMARVGMDESVQVPIFDCTLALPTIQCPLHIFEPKYRTLLRECLQSGSNKFGMCQSDQKGGHINYGTIMEVRHVRYLPDGRSIVDCVGGRRFKILSNGKDNGISLAKVEYFEDDTSALQSDIAKEQLSNKCFATYNTLSTYIGNLHPTERECITNAIGPLPMPQSDPLDCPNGESWVWWAASALPLNDKARLMMFKSQSLGDRVTVLQRFLNVLSKVRHRQGTSS